MPDNRRAPAKPRHIEDIDKREDIRVRIIGTILEAGDDAAMVDDGTASTEVFLDKEDLEAVEEGERVRIFGRVLPTPDGFEIQGELVQPVDVQEERYKKVRETVTHVQV
ncbi:MAG: hypothetical protein MUP66_01680 [Candidatus Nanohaloarchaeota archaeon QJJ-5]|nr:hypothetical protein [Candidatus Nanohaloarchaeota archaeon QJJ-5]